MPMTTEQTNKVRKRNLDIAKQIGAVIAEHTTTAKNKQQTVDTKSALYLLTMKHGPQVITDIIAYTVAQDTEDLFSSQNTVWANERVAKISREDSRYTTLHWASGVFACDINAPHTVINGIADLLRGGFAADQQEPEMDPPETQEAEAEPEEEPAPEAPDTESDAEPEEEPIPEPEAEALEETPPEPQEEILPDEPDEAERAVSAGDILTFNRLFAEASIPPAGLLPLYRAAGERGDRIGLMMAETVHETLHALYPGQKAALVYAAAAQGDMLAAQSLLWQPVFPVDFRENTRCLSLALRLAMERRGLDTAKDLISLGADVEDFIRAVPEPDPDGREFINELLAYWNSI